MLDAGVQAHVVRRQSPAAGLPHRPIAAGPAPQVPPNPGELQEMVQHMEREAEAERREAVAANEAFLARDLEAKAWRERARLARLGAETAASVAAGARAEAFAALHQRPQGSSTLRPTRPSGRKRRRTGAPRGRAVVARGATRGGVSSPTAAPAAPTASTVRRIDAYFRNDDSALRGAAAEEEQVTPPRAWAEGLGMPTPAATAGHDAHAPSQQRGSGDGPCSPHAQAAATTHPPGDGSPTASLWFCAQCTYGNRTWWLRCAACDGPKREWTKVDEAASADARSHDIARHAGSGVGVGADE